MTEHGLTCRELIDFLAAYLDGELPAPQRGAFDTHLAHCPECVRYLEGYRETVRLERRAFEDDAPPPDLPEELVQAILAARTRS
jgi:anti-sigma factor (TIGR02949 family)